ncbi:F0F1 ATP synthase subunit B family protein [Algihabitans albus]|uniref:F0F1 ATP synthase subunit B family protein n=1 Tax=Algihabitans albus TaxID=2164067 RepID=UPI000E5D29C7|nr:F0F1 ATP synthase subunit B [Algihabitans albus]
MLGSEYTWITLALFIFFALVFWKGFRPVLKSLDSRAERIRKELDEAQTLREDAQKMLAEYKRKQRDAIQEAEAIVEHAKLEAERLRKSAEADLEASLKRREDLALAKIEQAEQNALSEVRNQAVDVAIAAAAKLIAEQVDDKKAEELAASAIQDVAQRLN